jgi:hypothetical protein
MKRCPWSALLCALCVGGGSAASAATMQFTPDRDTAIYANSLNAAGAAQAMVAGTTLDGFIRRAMFRFDVDPLPLGAQVTSAVFRVWVDRSAPDLPPTDAFTLHRLTQDWGEASSGQGVGSQVGVGFPPVVGDATWQQRFFDPEPTLNAWTTPGGDFNAAASATANLDRLTGFRQWNSPGLAADVQAWLAAPQANFGWILRGEEGTPASGRVILSRENPVVERRPLLTIEYTLPDPIRGDMNNDTVVDNDDISLFVLGLIDLAAYAQTTGLADGAFRGDVNTSGDFDNEDIQGFVNLLLGIAPSPVPEQATGWFAVLGLAALLVARRK